MSTNKAKIKVLQCIRQGQIGGGESHLLNLVEYLDRNTFEPIVLSFTDGPMIDRLKELKVKTYIIPSTKPFDFRVWKKVKAILTKEKIDLIHAHGTRANSNIFYAANQLNIPVAYTIHGWSFHVDQPFFIKQLRIAGERFLTSKTKLNISVSHSNQLEGKKLIKGFESTIINYGIDQQKFNPNASYSDVRKEIGIPDKAILCLFLARFTNHKQPLTLLKAFQKLLKQHTDLYLLMVGDGDEKKAGLDFVKKHELGHRIIFQNFRQDVPNVLNAADIYILPSLWEGLPIGLLEAMSMKKAIIASAVDGTADILTHLQNGYLIELKNMDDELPTAISLLAKDPTLREKLGAQAFETVAHNYNVGFMTKNIETAYLKLLSK